VGTLELRYIIQAGVGISRAAIAGFRANVSATSKPGLNTRRLVALRLQGLSRQPSPKNHPTPVLLGPCSHTIEPQSGQRLRTQFHQRWGLEMRGSRRWDAEVTELGDTVVLARTAPREVWTERDEAWRVEQTPNMAVLGDPLPGRSALDAKNRLSPR
jgi:hypothetical protein